MEDRSWSASGFGYRHGFNGMEQDNEVKGDGNSLDFGARIYDSRLGRWMSRDPLASKQPSWSPYKAFLDNPILFVDPEGETETIQTIVHNQKTGKTTIMVSQANKLMTDGKVHKRDYKYGDGWYNVNNYYDYTTTNVVYTDGNGKILSSSSSTKIRYDKGVQDYEGVYFGGDDYGDTRTGNKPIVSGGIMFYSSNGQGQESKTTTGAVNMVDIGPILDAIGMFSPSEGLSAQLRKITKMWDAGDTKNAMKAFDKIVKGFEDVGEILDKGHTIKDNIEATQTKSSRTATDSVPCSNCERMIDPATMLGEGDAPDYDLHKIKDDEG